MDAYIFVGTEITGDLFDKTISLRPGVPNEVIVNLRWIPRDERSSRISCRWFKTPGVPSTC